MSVRVKLIIKSKPSFNILDVKFRNSIIEVSSKYLFPNSS
jgi:hypothetical protein